MCSLAPACTAHWPRLGSWSGPAHGQRCEPWLSTGAVTGCPLMRSLTTPRSSRERTSSLTPSGVSAGCVWHWELSRCSPRRASRASRICHRRLQCAVAKQGLAAPPLPQCRSPGGRLRTLYRSLSRQDRRPARRRSQTATLSQRLQARSQRPAQGHHDLRAPQRRKRQRPFVRQGFPRQSTLAPSTRALRGRFHPSAHPLLRTAPT